MTRIFKPYAVVAVSGGPDSMALLDMLYKQDQYHLVVCHVNYHQRETALRDELIVIEYCREHEIPYVVYDAQDFNQGNFQAQARDFRYRAFLEVYQGYQAKVLFLGHHQDDQLETILFTLLSKREPAYLGMKKHSKMKGMNIRRPLLEFTKEQLVEYCKKNKIDYGIDESNLELTYTRNKIRVVLNDLSDQDKQALLQYQKQYHKTQSAQQRKVRAFFKENEFSLEKYFQQDETIRLKILREFFKMNNLNTHKVSKKHLLELDKQLSDDESLVVGVSKNKVLCVINGKVYIEDKKVEKYEVIVDKIRFVNHSYFKLNRRHGTGFNVQEEDFPLTVRNVQPSDVIKLKFGTKKLNRYFIDQKIPSRIRRLWPVVVNKKGVVICVAGYAADLDHQQPINYYIENKL